MSRLDTAFGSASRSGARSPVGNLWALFLGVGLMTLGNGLQATLLGIRSSLEGFDTVVIGFIQAAYYGGFLLGSRFTMRALSKVGHVRVFAALASSASTAVLVFVLFVNPAAWLGMRFVTGFCMAGLFVAAESWLNDQSPPDQRGRILSIYMVVTMGAMTGGQLLLNVADPSGFQLFVIASILVSFSLVPMALTESGAPALLSAEPFPLRELLRVVPTGAITMVFSGAATGTVFSMAAVYGTQIGMSTGEVSLFIGASLFGAMLLQLPIGGLSDRVSRRGVMAGTSIAAAAASAIGIATSTGAPAIAVMFVIGASSIPLYSLALAYTNDWIEDGQRVGASGLLVIIAGVGAIIGPLTTAIAMRVFSPSGFFWNLMFIHGTLAVYLLYRIVSRAPKPIDEQTQYRAVPARSSPVAAAIGKVNRGIIRPAKRSRR